MSWKAKLFIISVLISILGLFLPYPTSLVIAFISSILIFLVMGVTPFVVSTVVIGFIVLSPFLARVAISEFYPGFFFRKYGRYFEGSNSQVVKNLRMNIPKVKFLTVDGVNLRVEIRKDATEVSLFGKMRLNSRDGYLRVYSKTSGKIVSNNLESLEINGMDITVSGDGDVHNLEINGIDSSVNLSNLTKLNLEVNGMSDSLKLKLHGSAQVEVNGMSNEIKITFLKDSSGEAFFNVNGTGNDIKIYIQKGSKIHIKSKPAFFNSVKIIELK